MILAKTRLEITSKANMKAKYTVYRQDNTLPRAARNFGRSDLFSQAVFLSAASLLKEGEYNLDPENTGLLAVNSYGALPVNLDYFQDYVENGRSLGRGNLFIYTLPTSALAETAIYWGYKGPLLYMSFRENSTDKTFAQVQSMIANKEAQTMMVFSGDTQYIESFLIQGD